MVSSHHISFLDHANHWIPTIAIDQAPKGDSEDDLPLQTAALGASCVVDYLKRATDDKGNKLPRELVVSSYQKASSHASISNTV